MRKPNLIDKLLDGVEVEWKMLGEVGEFTRGKRFVKTDMHSEGFPCIHYGEMYTHYKIWAETTKSFVSHDLASKLRVANHGDVVIVSAGETIEDIGKGTAWLGNSGVVIHDACFSFRSSLNPKYVSYFLRTKYFHEQIKKHISTGKISAINETGLSKAKIPIPPLKVQEEIIRILDAFTELTAKLTEELTAELTARKKQYEYYCREVVEHGRNATSIRIGDLGMWSGGSTPSMSNKDFWENGSIPWVSSKDMKVATLVDTQDHITQVALDNTSIKLLPANTVAIVARSGILKHTLPIVFIPFETTVNQDIKALVAGENVLPRYVFFALQGYHDELLANTKKQGGTVDSLEIKKFMDFEIPIPSLEEQKRIIAILDRFDTLCNDISKGLPAEIEARKKQYEYYRDMLFSFPKEEVEA